ncbi:MAG: glycosyltransferase [Betaproteobacteria bacterium]
MRFPKFERDAADVVRRFTRCGAIPLCQNRIIRMKILHAIQSVDRTGGGPIEGLVQLSQATSSRIEHEVVSIDSPGAACIRDFPLPLTAVGPAGILGYSPRLTPWVRAHRGDYDAVVIHGLWRHISVGTWRGLRGGPVPYLAFPHGMLDPWFKHTYPAKHIAKLMFWHWTEYPMLRDARAVIFTCEDERLRARESFNRYRCNEEIATLGIQAPPGEVEEQRQVFFNHFPALEGKRLLLFLSRINPKKGCDLLIEAFARAAARDARLHLVMAGPDASNWGHELRQAAQALGIAQRITWPGMLSGDLKWGAFRAAEAFILPSHQENFGIVVAEALACGLPVLISNQVQIWREVNSARAGFVAPDDLEGTFSLINRWLDCTPDQWLTLRRHALRCYREKFQASAYARRFEQIVDQYCTSRWPVEPVPA